MKRVHIILILFLFTSIATVALIENKIIVQAKPAVQTAGDHEAFLPIVGDNTLFVNWAFEETFDGDPSSPSQALLPDGFDFSVTHRTHPKEHFDEFDTFPADHDENCAGPNPNVSPLPQHQVATSHLSNGTNPDESFFICKNHMMSSMGHVGFYSISSYWPLQEFDFKYGGYLEFDVNINDNHPRSWFEILIAPRSELKVAAAPHDLPIDERYPKDRIVLRYSDIQKRSIQVGSGALDPDGVIVEVSDTNEDIWRTQYPNDPAVNDRRIRRKMRIYFSDQEIVWWIEKADGTFDELVAKIPGDLPFDRGIVVFKTHAYFPKKGGNNNTYTFHWDNMRFSGPVVGKYEIFEANDVVYLQANGDRQIGEQETVTIDLPHIGPNPILFGQVHQPKAGQVLLSINGRSNIAVHPYDYKPGTCSSTGWKTFQMPIDPTWLHEGTNTYTWTIGPSPGCAEDMWDGFSIKDLEIQFDLPD